MKNSGTYVRPQLGELPCDKSGTQVFPVPPRASENTRRSEPGPLEVSRLATVGVGTAEPPMSASGRAPTSSAPVGEPQPSGEYHPVTRTPAVPPPRRVRATPIINVNEPTRIFVISPPPLAEKNSDGVERRAATTSSDASGRTETFGTPSFSPVPSVSFSRAPQPAGVLASRAPQPANWKGLERSVAKPRDEASQLAQTLSEPLLRAFDDGRARQATWSTAKTITAPVLPVATAEEGAKAEDDRVEGDETKSSRVGVPRRLLENLRQSSAATKRISALVMVVVVVVGLGTLVAGRIANGVVPDSGGSTLAQPMRAAAHVEPRAAVAAPAVPPNSALMPSSLPLVEAAVAEPSTTRTPAIKVAHAFQDKPSTAPDVGASNEVTLARQAVDALLAGDRPKALLQYKELSRKAPDRKVYREAIRLLAPSPTDTPQ